MRRVVITGMAGICPLGHNWQEVSEQLKKVENKIQFMDEWAEYSGLNTRLAAPVMGFEKPAHYNRKQIRGMGRVALMSTVASERALQDAGLLDDRNLY